MTFVFCSFQLKLQYVKCSESVGSENKHAISGYIVLMYSKLFFNSKFKFQENATREVYASKDFLGVDLISPTN